jgi:hypothetical protein
MPSNMGSFTNGRKFARCVAPRGNRALVKRALLMAAPQPRCNDMSELADDPERRLTLRQAAQARDDFAMIMDELDFVKAQLARLPTRRHQAFSAILTVVTTAFATAALVILWCEIFGQCFVRGG